MSRGRDNRFHLPMAAYGGSVLTKQRSSLRSLLRYSPTHMNASASLIKAWCDDHEDEGFFPAPSMDGVTAERATEHVRSP